MQNRIALLPALLASLSVAGVAAGETPVFAGPQARILQSVDEATTVALPGNVHPLALANPSNTADLGTPMEHMILYLKGDSTQEAQLAALVAQLKDPKSALYGRYLTPQDFASQFGVHPSDIQKVTAWLESHGFTVEQIPAGNRSIVFSGTAGQVAEAFKTEIRQYSIAGKTRYANASDPQIPAALASVVGGVVKLHNFAHTANISKSTPVANSPLATPQFTSGSSHYLTPADYGIIYDINPLYSAGINGTGQTIAVIARSNIYLSDVQTFRSSFGLAANNPQIVIVNSNPGVVDGDSTETTLDTEWSGAVAPNASIKVIVAASTNTADGIDLSAQYAVSNNVAPIITLSYGSCEADMGTSELAFYNSLWQQAAAQGISVMVSAGDSGAAGCYSGSATSASGKGINGLCSSPYSTCVGGTEFVEGTNPGQYWLTGNNSVYGSAVSYIPEEVWNESGSNSGSGLWAGGGGASIAYAKPTWQTGAGVPADGQRDVPDVSLTASGHDGYLIFLYGNLYSVGGTSAAAPSFAGIMAMVDQKANARQGLANTSLYPLATNQSSGGPAVFHDTTMGNNSVPGVTGFSAAKGYDLASGLGSVDANVLVNNWTTGSVAATLSVSATPAPLTVIVGKSSQATITTTASSTLKAAVTLTVAGLPVGVTGTFSSSTIASPGSGSAALTIAAGTTAKAGTYSLTITAAGGGKTATTTLSVSIVTPTFTLSAGSTSVTVNAGGTAKVAIATTPQNGFSSAVALSISGLPTGVTAAFSPASIGGTAAGASTLTLTVATTAKSGTYPLTISGAGGGQTVTTALSVSVITPTFTLSAGSATVAAIAGSTAKVTIATTPQNGFSSAVALSISGLPTGVTAAFSPASIGGTAAGASTLTLTIAATAKNGTYPLTITGTGGGQTVTTPLSVSVATPTFTLSAGGASLTVDTGSTAKVAIATTPQNGFSSVVALSISGLPTGVTAAFSPVSIGGTAAAGASTLTLTIAANAKNGTYPLAITGTGGGQTVTTALSVSVVTPTFTLSAGGASLTVDTGSTAKVAIATTPQNGFSSVVALSISGLPTGVTAAFSPVSIGGTAAAGASTLTLTIAATAKNGTYPLTITGTGGGQTVTTALSVSVVTPTFTLSAGSTSVTVDTGSTAKVVIATTPKNGFSSAVALSISGLPTGVTAAFSPASIGGTVAGASTLTLTAAMTAKSGTYPLTIGGAAGGQTVTTALSVLIMPTFTLSAGSTSVTVNAGSTGKIAIATTPQNGFSSAIALSVSGLPTGVTAAFSPASIGGTAVGASTLTLTIAATTKSGSYPLSISATGGGVTQSLAVTLVTITPTSCTLAANPTSVKIAGGQSTTVALSCGAVQGTFAAPLSLSLSGAPAGLTVSAPSASLAAGSSTTLTIVSATTIAAGNYTLSLNASGSNFTQTLAIPLAVSALSTFRLTTAQYSATITAGTTTGQVSVTSAHLGTFNSAVSLSVTGMPTGVSASFSTPTLAAPGDGTSVVTFSAAASATAGTYTVAVTGTGGGQTETAPVTLMVVAPQNFTLAVSATSMTLQQGGAVSPLTISTGNFTGGFNSTITITFSGLAPGMNWSVKSSGTGNNLVNTTLNWTAAAGTPVGTYPMTVTATGAGITHTATVQVTVTKAAVQTVK